MIKTIYRTCPKCKDRYRLTIRGPQEPSTNVPIHARCPRCGFNLNISVSPVKKIKK